MDYFFETAFNSAAFWLLAVCLLIVSLFVLALPYGVFYVVSLPLRRKERARLLLDLLEIGLKSGTTPEQTIVSISLSRERSVGPRFHLLAAHLESGLRFEEALVRVPSLLPPQIVAMLKAGAQLGDLRKILPACRRLLHDGVSQTRSALNYLLLLLVFVMPVLPIMFIFLKIFIFPQFLMIAHEMGLEETTFLDFVVRGTTWGAAIEIGLTLLLWLLIFVFAIGPRLKHWGDDFLQPIMDWGAIRMPWRRKRLQRDFAAMLATLLDAGVPESTAIGLAAECTDNRVMIQQAATATRRLEEGASLLEALQSLDRAQELQWRVRNARHGQTGFLAALSGWLENLEAKAFQQEQAATQLLTTGLIVFNGILVGFMALGLFGTFVDLLQQAVLW